MAGTTLRGIGDDESDEETPPPEKEAASGPTVVDNAKVAESLRKLRSLEDRSGSHALQGGGGGVTAAVDNEATVPMTAADLPGVAHAMTKPASGELVTGKATPSSTIHSPSGAPHASVVVPPPSGQAGITGTLMGQPSATLLGLPTSAALGASEKVNPPTTTLIGQSLSTLMGHAAPEGSTRPVNTPAPIAEPPRPFRTLFGHSAPAPEEVSRELARHQPRPSRPTPGADGGGIPALDFSGKEQRFFESEPINDLYEPEFPRPKMFARVAVGIATASVVIVAVLAYFRFSGSDEMPVVESTAPPTVPQAAAAQPPPPGPAAAPSPTAAATAPAPPAPATGAGPPASDDPALKTTPTPPVPAATAAATTDHPATSSAELATESKTEARKEPSLAPKLETKPEPKPAIESKPAIARSEVKKEAVKSEATKSPVAKLTAKEPPVATKVTAPKEHPAKPIPAPVAAKPVVPAKPVAAAPKLSGFQARTDSPKTGTTATTGTPPKTSKPVTSLSSPRDSASRPMKIGAPTAPGTRPAAAPKPGGKPKVEDDPDATLPLSE
jgi:hypothetical protein